MDSQKLVIKKAHVQVHYWVMTSLAVDHSAACHSGHEAEKLCLLPKKICPAIHHAQINCFHISRKVYIYLCTFLLHAQCEAFAFLLPNFVINIWRALRSHIGPTGFLVLIFAPNIIILNSSSCCLHFLFSSFSSLFVLYRL